MCAESSPVNYVTMPGLQRWKWGRFPARVPGDGNEAAGIKSVQNTAIPMDSLWTPYGTTPCHHAYLTGASRSIPARRSGVLLTPTCPSDPTQAAHVTRVTDVTLATPPRTFRRRPWALPTESGP